MENDQGDLTRIAVNSTIWQQYMIVQEEYGRGMRVAGNVTKYDYIEMRTLYSIILAQAFQYPEILKKHNEKWDALNKKYGDPEFRSWEFKVGEATERKGLLEALMRDLGITRVDARPEPPEVQKYEYGYRYDGRVIINSYWKKREGENKNLNLVFTGKVGGGKSYASISTGNYLNRNYDLSNVCYTIADFIERVQTQPKGTVIILDEAGVSASNRDTMTKESKTLSKVIETTRYLQQISIFNLPNLAFLDKHVKTMLDLVFIHDADMNQGEFSVSIPELTEDGKDIELNLLRYDHKIMKSVYFPLPPPYMIADYELHRERHNKEQLEELHSELWKKREKEKEKNKVDGRGKNPKSLNNLTHFKKEEEE